MFQILGYILLHAHYHSQHVKYMTELQQQTHTYTRRVGNAHPQNLQRDSSAVDITVGGDFLGLRHQQSSSQQGSYSQWLWGLGNL